MPEVLFIVNTVTQPQDQSYIDEIDSYGAEWNVTVQNRIDIVISDFDGKHLAVIGSQVNLSAVDLKTVDIPFMIMGRGAANDLFDMASALGANNASTFVLQDTSKPDLIGTYTTVNDVATTYQSTLLMHAINNVASGVDIIWSHPFNTGWGVVTVAEKGATLLVGNALNRIVTFCLPDSINATNLTDVASPSGGLQLYRAAIEYAYEASLKIVDSVFSDAAQTIPYTAVNLKYWAMSTTTDTIISNGTVNPDGSGEIQIADNSLVADDYLLTYRSSDNALLGVEKHTVV